MKLNIDLDRCVMAGECVFTYPAFFTFGEDGYPVVLRSEVMGDDYRVVAEDAVSICPSGAISEIES